MYQESICICQMVVPRKEETSNTFSICFVLSNFVDDDTLYVVHHVKANRVMLYDFEEFFLVVVVVVGGRISSQLKGFSYLFFRPPLLVTAEAYPPLTSFGLFTF